MTKSWQKVTELFFFDKIWSVKKKENEKMILSNFLYFIVAILFFSAAPMAPTGVFTPAQNLMAVVVILLGFWHFNRYKFTQLRIRLNNEEISLEAAKKEYFTHINIHFIIAIILFAFEIFAFDLKFLVLQTSIPGFFETEIMENGISTNVSRLIIRWRRVLILVNLKYQP